MLENVKLLLGLKDSGKDSILSLLISQTEAALRNLLGTDIPEELSHIVEEVTVKRFNRIGSEGTSSHSVEGESMTYEANDFAPYSDEIEAYKRKFHADGSRGVTFL